MKLLISVLLALSMNPSEMRLAAAAQQPDRRLQNLEREKERLKHESDPIDRTKTDIKISEILLSLTGDAVRTGDMDAMQQRLDDYVSTINDAHEALTKAHRDAHKKPKGFKDLEISLRRQVNQLKDIGGALSYDQRQPIDNAREQASRIREDLLKALFGNQNAPDNY